MDRSELQAAVAKAWSEAMLVERHPVLRRLQARPGIPVRAAQASLELDEDTGELVTVPADHPDGFLVVPFFRDTDGEGFRIVGLEYHDPADDYDCYDYTSRLGCFEDAYAVASGKGGSHEKTLVCGSWREAVVLNAMTGFSAIAAPSEDYTVTLAAARGNAIVVLSSDDDGSTKREARRAGVAVVEPPDDFPSWEELVRHKGLTVAAEAFKERLEQGIEDLQNAIPIYMSDSLPAGDDRPHAWEGIVRQNSFGVLYGQPGTGKSFCALGLALSVASGRDYLGRRTTPGPAVYVAGEGGEDVQRRIEAWRLENGVQGCSLPLAVVPRAVMLDQPGEVERLAEAIDSIFNEPPRLLVVDTLNRCFSGDENSARDMSKFIAACDWLKTRFPGLAVLVVHHSNKSDQQDIRGSSALLGAVDMAAVMMAQQGRPSSTGRPLVLRCVKAKDTEPFPDSALLLSQVPLSGLDPYGRPSSSCVLRLRDGPRHGQPSAGVQSVLDALQGAAALSDDEGGGVSLSDWRAAYYATAGGMEKDTQRKAFSRGKTELLKEGFVWQSGNLFYPKDGASSL